MKTVIIGLFLLIAHISAFSQSSYQTIKISSDLELIKISDNAYVHVSYSIVTGYGRVGANGLIFINNKEAFLFDTPWNDSLTMELIDYVNDSLKVKVVGFVPNHWHEDCTGGLGFIRRQGIASYANQMTIDIAESEGLAMPEHGFKDSLQLQLGDKSIHCYYPGAAHSLDNIVVWIPSERILFAGCMVKGMNSKDLGNTADGDLVAYPKTIDSLIKKFSGARIVIPGHGQFGGFDLLIHTRDLISTAAKGS